MRPFTGSDARPFALAADRRRAAHRRGAWLASRRDVGNGVVVARDRTDVRPFGLTSDAAFVVREQLGSIVAWLVGIAAGGFALGIVAEVADDALSRSSVDVLHRLGVSGSLVHEYFGVAFLLLAATIALVPAPQLTSAAEDETDGRLALLLTLPVARWRHFTTRLAVAIAAVTAAGLFAAVGVWLGAASQGVDIGLGSLLGAGLNVVPVAAVVLGVGAVALAWKPRARRLPSTE